MDTEHIFYEIFESHRGKVYGICCCCVHDSDAREDVYQEVLVHIWMNLHTFQMSSF